jgi:hypothetical protein
LIEGLLEQTVKFWFGHAASLEIGMRLGEAIPQTQLRKQQPRVDGFNNQGIDALARRFGFGPKAIFSCWR